MNIQTQIRCVEVVDKVTGLSILDLVLVLYCFSTNPLSSVCSEAFKDSKELHYETVALNSAPKPTVSPL